VPTLVEGLLARYGALPAASGATSAAAARPGIVHRLDKDTTGVLVCALTAQAHAALARQFHDKVDVRREYVALLDGVPPRATITHESYLMRDPKNRLRFASVPKALHEAQAGTRGPKRRYAKSVFTVRDVYGHRLALASVRLYTGRTHQIRVHARDLGCPVVGDLVYGRAPSLPTTFSAAARAVVAAVERQLLHARLLGVKHPITGQELQFTAEYPDDFARVLATLKPFATGPISC
jgi:RluA family pseudouridine synthase